MKKLLAVSFPLICFAALGLAKSLTAREQGARLRMFQISGSVFTMQIEALPLSKVHRPIPKAHPDPYCPWFFIPDCDLGGGVMTNWPCVQDYYNYAQCMEGCPPHTGVLIPSRSVGRGEPLVAYWRKRPDIVERLR